MKNPEQLVQDVYDGIESPFTAFAFLKKNIDRFGLCLEAVKEYAIQQAELEDSPTFEKDGYNWQLKNGRKTYSFKNIDEWNEQHKILKKIEDKYKAVDKNQMAQLHSVTEDGEMLQSPIVTYSKPSLIIKPLES